MDKYEDLIEQYVEKFDEGFPTFMAPGGEEEHMEIIKNCLKTGNCLLYTSDAADE